MMDYRQNPHREIIQQCAAAVAAGMEPVVVQTRDLDKWFDLSINDDGMPVSIWDRLCEYRIKPRTVTVHGTELPEPLMVTPDEGEKVYHLNLDGDAPCGVGWKGSDFERKQLARGLLHSTREAAEQWREFLLSMTRGVK